jgi:hypothetical protein
MSATAFADTQGDALKNSSAVELGLGGKFLRGNVSAGTKAHETEGDAPVEHWH